jgi:hypothetical protein
LKQIRSEKDELFVNNQKLKQEKLAAEVCFDFPFGFQFEMHEFFRQKKVPVPSM